MSNISSEPPKITLCVGGVVFRQGRVLFVRQAGGDLLGKWSLPWGYVDGMSPDGNLEPPEMAVLREIREEAGVVAEVDGLLGIQNHSNDQGELRVYLLFLCHHVQGEPRPDHQETDCAAYFSTFDLDHPVEPFDEFCLWLARRVLRGEYFMVPAERLNPYQPHLAYL